MTPRDDREIKILYEDNHLICAVKPRGVLSQADGGGAPDMPGILKKYIKQKYGKPGDAWLGLVHRLDRPVGGVMVFARTSKAAARLSDQIKRRTVNKTYFAIVRGTPPEAEGCLTHIIKKNKVLNMVTVTDISITGAENAGISYATTGATGDTPLNIPGDTPLNIPGGTPLNIPGGTPLNIPGGTPLNIPGVATLYYKVVATAGESRINGDIPDISLLSVNLITGKPHQIRAQLSYAGFPVLGDKKYGVRFTADGVIGWPALFAYSIALDHPITRERLVFSSLPPEGRPWDYFDAISYSIKIE